MFNNELVMSTEDFKKVVKEKVMNNLVNDYHAHYWFAVSDKDFLIKCINRMKNENDLIIGYAKQNGVDYINDLIYDMFRVHVLIPYGVDEDDGTIQGRKDFERLYDKYVTNNFDAEKIEYGRKGWQTWGINLG